jgi:hypothetical protein
MSDVENSLPAELDWDEDEVETLGSRERLRAGVYYQFVIVDAATAIAGESSKNPGSYQLKIEAAPLKEPGDGQSETKPHMYVTLTLPKRFVTPEGERKNVGTWAFNQCASFFSAVTDGNDDDEVLNVVPAPPHWNRELKRTEIDGEPATDQSEVKARRVAVREALVPCMGAAWKHPSELVGCVFYAPVNESKDANGEMRSQIDSWGFKAELPEGAELADPDDFVVLDSMTLDESPEPEAEPEDAPQRRRKKASKRATRKASSRRR